MEAQDLILALLWTWWRKEMTKIKISFSKTLVAASRIPRVRDCHHLRQEEALALFLVALIQWTLWHTWDQMLVKTTTEEAQQLSTNALPQHQLLMIESQSTTNLVQVLAKITTRDNLLSRITTHRLGQISNPQALKWCQMKGSKTRISRITISTFMTVLNPKTPKIMINNINSRTLSLVWIPSKKMFNKTMAKQQNNKIQMSRLAFTWRIIWLCVESKSKETIENSSWILKVRSSTWTGNLSVPPMQTNLRSFKKTPLKINSSNNKMTSWITAWRWEVILSSMPREISTICKINTKTTCKCSRIIKRKWCSWTTMMMINRRIKIMCSMITRIMAKIINRYDLIYVWELRFCAKLIYD